MTNEQIAELVGFKRTEDKTFTWIDPQRCQIKEFELPDFLHSFDACEKWIVPVLKEKGLKNRLTQYGFKDDGVLCTLEFKNTYPVVGSGTTEFEAFCEAAYKYLKGVK